MLARCARCQGTFTTDKFGLQTCPHCGSELMLADPAGGATPPPPAPPLPEAAAAPPGPPPAPAAPGTPPPPSGWGPVPSGPAWQGGAPPPSGWGPLHPPPPPAFGEQASPFAERSTRGFFSAFFETFKLVGTQPADFFRRVRIDQTGAALLFGVLGSTVGNWFSVAYGYLTRAATLSQLQARVADLPPEAARIFEQFASTIEVLTSPGATAAQLLVAPLLSLISIYLVAGAVHLVLMLFKGAGRGFDATLTVVAYASGLYLVMAVPQCGGLIAVVWYLAVLIIGLGEAHRCGAGKAALAVFSPIILVCLCCCGLAGVAGAGAWSAFQQAAQAVKGTPIP